MTRHEHYAQYDFQRDALYCPGCGRSLLGLEVLWRLGQDGALERLARC